MAEADRRSVALVAILVVLHFGLRPFLTDWPVAPDLLTAAVLLGALSLRAGAAAILGFSIGLLEEALALGGGWTALLYTIAAYVGARFREIIFTDLRLFVPLYLFLGTWAIRLMLAALTSSLDARTGLVIAPVDALLTTVVAGVAEAITGRRS